MKDWPSVILINSVSERKKKLAIDGEKKNVKEND